MKFALALLLLSSTTFAEVTREEASLMIDKMVKSNMISAEEAQKAKDRLKTMNTTEWSKLNKEAEAKAARMPASVPEQKDVDLSREQMSAIESDLKTLAPQVIVPETKVQEVIVPKVTVPQT